jgi:SAM-dependent methyltransferase
MGEPAPYRFPDATVLDDWAFLRADCALWTEDIYPAIARRLASEGVRSFLELGGDLGPIARDLVATGASTVVLDLSDEALARALPPAVKGDLRALPVRPSSFDAISATNCLYFLADPIDTVRQAYDALRPGGWFVASAPSRYHDPELQEVEVDWGRPSPFDAEEAGEIVGAVFVDVEVEWWESPAWRLRDREAVARYLRAFGNPDPFERAQQVTTPVDVTKSGAHVWARKPG